METRRTVAQRRYAVTVLGTFLCGWILSAQAPAVEFGRNVQPIFKTQCYGCHGPALQMNGLRLDRRRNAMPNRVGSNGATIVPGNSGRSRLYLKISGSQAGLQMPPTGALSQEEIGIIKTWIDQGAEWPDELSGEAPATAPDPRVARMMEALKNGNRQAFQRALKEETAAVNLKGADGNTPLMCAALSGDAESVRLLLESGADPNIGNDARATALMYALDNVDAARLLLDHRADPNARSGEGRTPLVIAASGLGSNAVIKLLLDHGANPSVKPSDGSAPLILALPSLDVDLLRMFLKPGVDLRPFPLPAAVREQCAACVDLLLPSASRANLTNALTVAVRLGDNVAVKKLLDRGADISTADGRGDTVLMLAAASETAPVDVVKMLLERGANISAKNSIGETALDLAKQQGTTPVVDLLVKAGAKEESAPASTPVKPKPASSIRAAVGRSLPLLQRADVDFFSKSGCMSCHNNSLAAMTVSAARKNGFRVDEKIARTQLRIVGDYLESWRERVLEGDAIPGRHDTISYILLGMAAENYAPDAATDAMARYVKSRQSADGRWVISAMRPPQEASDIEITAVSLRALQVYAPRSQRARYHRAVQLGAAWLAKAEPRTNEDRTFQLLGLHWVGSEKEITRKAARDLVAEQRPDGGWAQLPSLSSDAYATGQSLVALRESGALAATDPVYKRGVQFLLNTQLEDGSWYVKTRTIPIQPHFDSGFPHGRHQFISAAATNWATTALVFAAR